jgi:EAL domain-containing protein (putative c-di-GMP-specific phosphodiesterase class I)
VKRTLAETGLPAQRLELEITERVLMQKDEGVLTMLHQLRSCGIRIALDDFGTGYSSLTSLEQLPISRVKLDRMLIEGIDTNPRSAAIVRSIVALSHGLGLHVIAEGVERPSQLEMLYHCGPLAVQGYLLAHPVEADQAAEESRAAVARAKSALEAAASSQQADTVNRSLVFIGPGTSRKKSS